MHKVVMTVLKHVKLPTALLLIFASNPAIAAPLSRTAAIARALADPTRPAKDTEADRERAPAETLTFAGIKPGQVIDDNIANGGYYTRLLAGIVGSTGRVYSVELEDAIKLDAVAPGYAALRAWAPSSPQVTIQVEKAQAPFKFPRKLDVFWLTQNYPDLHDEWLGPYDVPAFNRRVFAALKPGGTYLIVDHSAGTAAAADVTETLHRIDPAVVRTEVEQAGFCFAGESNALRNPADPHTAGIINQSIRGRTDRFIYKFRRPLKAGAC
jgi:predicted methyltransferase